MKLIHVSDLHIGKRLYEYSLAEEQEYMLGQLLGAAEDIKPDGVIIAGDIYDKSVPSGEAVTIFDKFLTELSEKGISVYIIAGNHDSAERLAFAASLLEKNNIYISNVFDGHVKQIVKEDEYGKYAVHLLPFVKPLTVKPYYPDAEINSYTDAVKAVVNNMNIDKGIRNIIVSHQFVTGSDKSGSEDLTVGGLDNVDADAYDPFDYVALGHIHSAQSFDGSRIHYPGTQLKYSFTDKAERAFTIVEIKEKGNVTLEKVPLKPLRDMTEITGYFSELMSRDYYGKLNLDNYYHITLKDDEIENAMSNLRKVYPNIMRLDFDNTRTRTASDLSGLKSMEEMTPEDYVNNLFEKQTGKKFTDEQREYIESVIGKIWEDNE